MPPTSLTWVSSPPRVAGVVLVLHGGAVTSDLRNRPWSHNVARLVPVARRIAGDHPDLAVVRLRFTVLGWNGERESPVGETQAALAQIRERHPGAPIVLVGHSMGARTAIYVGDEPGVVGIVGLAPWVERTDPFERIARVPTVLVHGDRDTITPLWASRLLVERLRPRGYPVSLIRVVGADHAMIRRARTWHHTASALAAGLIQRAADPVHNARPEPDFANPAGSEPEHQTEVGGIDATIASVLAGQVAFAQI